MRRILHITSSPSGVGGAERVLAALASSNEDGWTQAVINVAGSNPQFADLCPDGLLNSASGRPVIWSGWRTAAAAASKFKPDILHAHLPLAMIATATIRRRHGQVRVATHHHGEHFAASNRRAATFLDRQAGLRFDRIVAPSEAVRDFLRTTYGYDGRKITTIVNGWGDQLPSLDSRRQHTGSTIVTVANFRAQKNHALLVRAFAAVHDRLPDVRLLLVGSGPLESEVKALVESLGLTRAVEFSGYVDDVWPYLARSDLFALASRYEPLGVAVLEAMAYGLPVVATSVGGVKELVEPDVNGKLVDTDSATEMAEAIISILQSDSTMESMGLAAQTVAAQHTTTAMVSQYFDLYRSLASRPDTR